MANFTILTRRGALAALGAAAIAPPALAAPGISFPLRIAYARVAPAGFVHIRTDEQAAWTRMATRLGGLVEIATPLQPADMLGGGLPKIEGPANCALIARQMAAHAGYGHVILYATQDGQGPSQAYDNWFSETFANLTANLRRDGRASGEAHLLSIDGGMPLASAHADASPRDALNLLDGDRNPERETLNGLTEAMERRLQDMARRALESQRSIAD
jgi:hypothetical protein